MYLLINYKPHNLVAAEKIKIFSLKSETFWVTHSLIGYFKHFTNFMKYIFLTAFNYVL